MTSTPAPPALQRRSLTSPTLDPRVEAAWFAQGDQMGEEQEEEGSEEALIAEDPGRRQEKLERAARELPDDLLFHYSLSPA